MQFVALPSNLLNIQFILILGILILLCNDIAENPGPVTDLCYNDNVKVFLSVHKYIITNSVVLWKIQKFDWLIPETK